MMNNELYNLYKPLRNHLRPVAIENAFYVIWAYINFFQFDKSIPNDIQFPRELIENKDKPNRAISEWELALLAREVISNGTDSISFATKNFNNWDYFATAINKIKAFENNAWPIFGDKSNVLDELGRIAKRQFPWQIKTSSVLFLRHFKIFSNPRIAKMIEEKIGLTIQQWYVIGTALLGSVLGHPKVNIDPNIQISSITKKHFDHFLSYISTDLNNLKEIINRDVKYDDQFVYCFNPLEYYPLVKIGNYYYCPISIFLAWRITSGIYFDLDKSGRFGDEFGHAFQDYLMEISNKVISDSGRINVLPESKYQPPGGTDKDSVDIILKDGNSAIFLESKTKRLSVRSRSELLSRDSINKDIGVLAQAVVQIYSTILDYEKGLYPHMPYNQNLKIYPIVVTLEDWFIFGKDAEDLQSQVTQLMTARNIPPVYLEKMPYVIAWTLDYETLIQLINQYSIGDIMSAWFMPDKVHHNFGQFLATSYHGQYKYIDDYFPGDFEKIYPDLLMRE
ncbi:MAG: hypothetical protein Q8O88_04810 [bacterium]|nr:hypothetical protein [bacterium]